ncbi:hypothetical protein [Pseudolactococcus yaeyamensis]
MLILVVVIALLLTLRKINIVQFIAVSMLLSVLWCWLSAHLLVHITFRYKIIKILMLIFPSLMFVFLFYGIFWQYIPMDIIENNSHFGPSESVVFNSDINLGTYLANLVQQLVITTVLYIIMKYVKKLKH